MGRIKGIASFSANFETQMAGPLDARVLVDNLADLILESTWTANDGINYIYRGIFVAVANDLTPENNGLYMLMKTDYSDISNWNKVGGLVPSGGTFIYDWVSGTTYGKYTPLANNSNLYRVAISYTSSDNIQDDIDGGFLENLSGSGSTSGYTYTNVEPTYIEVGGFGTGSTFNDMSLKQFYDKLFYPELNPTSLKLPSSTFTLTQAGFREIGEVITTLNFNSTFDRGEILPAYGTSGFRSGLPNTYRYTGSGLLNKPSILLTDSVAIPTYTVLAGLQSWTGSVSFDGGEQPLTNKGNVYGSVLSAGTTTPITRSITGVYPYFGTSVSITEQTKQTTLSAHNASFWQVDMVGEQDLVNRQTAWIPKAFTNVIGIRFWNTNSSTWDWINLTPANSLDKFTKTDTQISVNGTLVDYWVYTHNSSQNGARRLRFYTTA